MKQNIKTINLLLPLKIGSVNCYLVEVESGYILIDTGSSNARYELGLEIENAGCRAPPGAATGVPPACRSVRAFGRCSRPTSQVAQAAPGLNATP